MNCWHCNTQLIWGGDHDYEDYGMEEPGIVTNLSCSKCRAMVFVHLPLDAGKSVAQNSLTNKEKENTNDNNWNNQQ